MMIKLYENAEFDLPVSKYNTSYEVVDCDTFTAAKEFPGCCCLNFASHKRVGGGYKNVRYFRGLIKTQEEDLFRRSNLPELMDIQEVRENYPLMGVKGLYTDEVIVDKDMYLNSIKSFDVSVITVAAVVSPQTTEQIEMGRKKIKLILNIAAQNNTKELILGAWGCGVFNNDPVEVAGSFHDYLENEFKGVFSKVVFAIPGKNNNFKVFDEFFR